MSRVVGRQPSWAQAVAQLWSNGGQTARNGKTRLDWGVSAVPFKNGSKGTGVETSLQAARGDRNVVAILSFYERHCRLVAL